VLSLCIQLSAVKSDPTLHCRIPPELDTGKIPLAYRVVLSMRGCDVLVLATSTDGASIFR